MMRASMVPRVPRPGRRRAFGDTTDWGQWYASPGEVYLWRAMATGADFQEPADANRLLRSVALAAADLSLDVRGIVVSPTGAVTVVFTADTTTPYVDPTTAVEVANHVLADSAVRDRFPELSLQSARWMQLTGPPASVDFWKAHAIVWDDDVGPLDAFAKQQGIYRGPNADAGPQLAPWATEPPDLGNGKDGKDQGNKDYTIPSWVLPAAVVVAGAFAVASVWNIKERAR